MKWLLIGLVEIAVFLAVVGVAESQAARLLNAALAAFVAFVLGALVTAHLFEWTRP